MSKEIPPGDLAQLDQLFAEATDKWEQLVGILGQMEEEHGIYGAMAVMGASLERSATKETLISMILTGMRLEMTRRENSG